jgi:glycosyltransferase involved in cell wall biosynthesis
MIVRNEEKNLPVCLESVKGLFDEIVIVDTGSTDRTKEIAKSYGAKVIDFTWIDDFSAARNRSLDEATGQWIFWLDADHFIDKANYNKLKKLFSELGDENIAYVVCEISHSSQWITDSTVHVRLFKNDPRIRWVYPVHEQLQNSLNALNIPPKNLDILIQHTGYIDPATQKRKVERNIAILEKERREHPQEPAILAHALFDLARSYRGTGKLQEALEAIVEASHINKEQNIYYSKVYWEMALIYQALERWEEALKAYQKLKEIKPKLADLYFQESLVYEQMGDLKKAQACLQVISDPQALFRTDDPHLGVKIYYQMAVLCYKQGETGKAEKYLKSALQLDPSHTNAWIGLAQLFASQGRSIEALAASHRAQYLSSHFVDAVYWESIAWSRLGYPENATECLKHYLQRGGDFNRILNTAIINIAEIHRQIQGHA